MGAPEPGATLAGKYVVERVLGVGGMGVVVAARHIQLDQKVAIKYLLPDALANPEIVERFAREARAAAKIRGEHVARVIDVGTFDDGAPFMVLEYLEGENLEDLLERRGPLPIAEAIGYVLETCEALAEAHAAGIVHRDLKPANLFLARQPDRRSIVKVLDFGISKVVDPSGNGITKTSSVMGTPFYMSPEQLVASKGVDARSDIWALGVILYELITRTKPFDGETLAEIVGAILQNEPARLSSLRGDVGLDLELCVARCLASKPANRHASVKELALALAPFSAADQRATIEKIARVLGDSLAPPGNAAPPDVRASAPILLAADLAPPSGFDATAIVGSGVVVAGPPPAASASVETKPGASAGAVTSHAVATGIEPRPVRRSPLPKIAIGLALAAAAVGVALALRTGPAPSAPQGMVGGELSTATAAPLATGAGAATAAGTGIAAPATEPSPADAGVAAAVAASGTASATALTPTSRKEAPPVASTAPHAPRAVAAHAAVAVPSSKPNAPAAVSASKNPLDMGIK